MSSVGSSERGSHDGAEELMIQEASTAISALASHYRNAVRFFPETSLESAVKLKFKGLDVLQKEFEVIFPHVRRSNTKKISDAVSLRKERRNVLLQLLKEEEKEGQIEEQERQIGDNEKELQIEEQKRQIEDLKCRLEREKEDCRKAVKDKLMFESSVIEYGGLYQDLRVEYEHSRENWMKDADKLQHAEALNRQLANEKENTERRNVSLEKQIAELEGKRSKQTVAGGVYSSSEADPTTLGTVARDIKSSLATFARTLMEDMSAQMKTDFLQTHHTGITFSSRKTDIKYAFQEWAAKLVFQGLWESDSFSYKCLPVGQEVEETQEFYFTRYRQLKSTRPSDVLGRLTGSTCGQCSGVCDCGWIDFNQFLMDKWGALKDSCRHMVEVSMGSAAAPLWEDFVALLTNVWLAHLLTLAFEQPATLFKVKSGTRFVPAHMEPTMLEVEPTTDNLTVAFMIIPGFRVGKSVIKSLVYVSPIQIPSEPDALVANQAPSQLAASISNDDAAHPPETPGSPVQLELI